MTVGLDLLSVGEQSHWPPMAPQINSLSPLIQVFDMVESLAFYRDVLGFEIHQHAPWFDAPYRHCNWVWLKRGEAELMLNTAYEADERPVSRDAARVEAHRDTVLYLGCPDVDEAYRQLKDARLTVKPPVVAPYGMKQLTLSDPDGYLICLQSPAG
jgi:glyoxylase I family protein